METVLVRVSNSVLPGTHPLPDAAAAVVGAAVTGTAVTGAAVTGAAVTGGAVVAVPCAPVAVDPPLEVLPDPLTGVEPSAQVTPVAVITVVLFGQCVAVPLPVLVPLDEPADDEEPPSHLSPEIVAASQKAFRPTHPQTF